MATPLTSYELAESAEAVASSPTPSRSTTPGSHHMPPLAIPLTPNRSPQSSALPRPASRGTTTPPFTVFRDISLSRPPSSSAGSVTGMRTSATQGRSPGGSVLETSPEGAEGGGDAQQQPTLTFGHEAVPMRKYHHTTPTQHPPSLVPQDRRLRRRRKPSPIKSTARDRDKLSKKKKPLPLVLRPKSDDELRRIADAEREMDRQQRRQKCEEMKAARRHDLQNRLERGAEYETWAREQRTYWVEKEHFVESRLAELEQYQKDNRRVKKKGIPMDGMKYEPLRVNTDSALGRYLARQRTEYDSRVAQVSDDELLKRLLLSDAKSISVEVADTSTRQGRPLNHTLPPAVSPIKRPPRSHDMNTSSLVSQNNTLLLELINPGAARAQQVSRAASKGARANSRPRPATVLF